MKHIPLTSGQKAATGFTDLYVVTHADATAATDTTDQVLDLDTLAFGDLIGYHALIEIVTVWDAVNVSADNVLAVSLGVTSALTQIIGASTIATAGAGVAAKTAFAPAAGGAPYVVPTGGKTLQLNLDITDADGALVDYSAGELHVWVNISRWNERTNLMTV